MADTIHLLCSEQPSLIDEDSSFGMLEHVTLPSSDELNASQASSLLSKLKGTSFKREGIKSCLRGADVCLSTIILPHYTWL